MPPHLPLPDDLPRSGATDAQIVLDHLHGLDEDRLTALVTHRPDLLRGNPPASLDEVARRMSHRGHVRLAVEALDVPRTIALHAVLLLDRGATLDRLVDLLDADGSHPGGHRDTVTRLVENLTAVGLVVPRPADGTVAQRLVVVPGVRQALTPLVPGAGLLNLVRGGDQADLTRRLLTWGLPPGSAPRAVVEQRVRHVLGDPVLLQHVLSRAPRGTAVGVDAWAATSLEPHAFAHTPHHVVDWALEQGLAWRTPLGPVLSRETVLALLAGRFRLPLPTRAPDLPTTHVPVAAARRAAAGAAGDLLSGVMGVVELLGRQPVARRQDGAVGAREITRTAKALKITPSVVRLALGCALDLRLLAHTRDGSITTAAEATAAWRRRSPAQRYADVLQSWWTAPTVALRDRDLEDGPTAIGGPPTAIRPVEVRHALLAHLATLAPEDGVTSGTAVFRHLGWFRPNAVHEDDVHEADDVLAEAELTGAVGAGVLSGLGHALLAGNRADLVREAELLLPASTDRATFGSDLTVLVAGNPAAHVVDLLDTAADREARGAANSWRFTDASFGRALDAGYAADDVLDALRELSDKPLPQPLEYFARDVARRYGRIGIRPAATVLVGDEALIAEVSAHSGLREVGVHQIAPTVAVSGAARSAVLDAVRAAGYLPRAEEVDGTPEAPAITLQRTGSLPPSESPAEVAPGSGATASPAAEVLRLLAGVAPPADPAVAVLQHEIRQQARSLSTAGSLQLAHAIVHGRAVRVWDRYGSTVLPRPSVEGSWLFGADRRHPLPLQGVQLVVPLG